MLTLLQHPQPVPSRPPLDAVWLSVLAKMEMYFISLYHVAQEPLGASCPCYCLIFLVTMLWEVIFRLCQTLSVFLCSCYIHGLFFSFALSPVVHLPDRPHCLRTTVLPSCWTMQLLWAAPNKGMPHLLCALKRQLQPLPPPHLKMSQPRPYLPPSLERMI